MSICHDTWKADVHLCNAYDFFKGSDFQKEVFSTSQEINQNVHMNSINLTLVYHNFKVCVLAVFNSIRLHKLIHLFILCLNDLYHLHYCLNLFCFYILNYMTSVWVFREKKKCSSKWWSKKKNLWNMVLISWLLLELNTSKVANQNLSSGVGGGGGIR